MSVQEAARGQVKFAGFWRRLAAYLIDMAIISIVYWMLYPLKTAGIVIYSIIVIFYFIGFQAGRGQTPGKAALGIKIIRSDGTKISAGTAILRYIGYIISSVIACIGFIIIAFQGKNQGLHDLIANTVVIIDRSPFRDAYSSAEFEESISRMDEATTKHHEIQPDDLSTSGVFLRFKSLDFAPFR